MLNLNRLAWLKAGAPPRNVAEAAFRARFAGGAGYEKTVGPAPIISISDAKAKPAKSLIVGMEPIQDLHGYDSPWPAGGGKNILNPAFDWTKSSGSGVNIDSSADGTITLSGAAEELNVFDSVRSIPSGTYTFSCFNNSADSKVQIYLIDSQGAVPGNFGLNVANKTATFTSENELTKLRIRALAGFSGTFTFKPMMVSGDTATAAWSPYENLCPISGRTGANIYHSGADTSTPSVITVSWQTEAGTVYGGTVDVVSGVLTVTMAQIASYNGEALPGKWISDRDVYAEGTFPTTDAQVVYELATPITYQLTPTQIQLLKGSNVLWSDADELTLTYIGTEPEEEKEVIADGE